MSLKQNVDNLRGICESEGITISDAGLMWIAEAADGSARDAQSILDQVISYAGQQIEDGDIQDLLGLTDRRFLNRFSEAVIEGDAAQCLRIVEEAYYAGVDMKFFYQMLLGHFRNLLLLKILGDHHSLLDLTGDELMVMKNQIKISSRETLQQHLDILMAEEEAVRKSPNPRLNLEAILVRMAYLDPIIPIDRIMARIEGIERRLSSGVPASPGTFKAAVAELTDRLYGTDSEALDGMEDYSSDLPANAVDEPAANPVYDDQRIDEPAEFNPETFRNDFLQFARVKNLRLTAKIEPGKLSYEDGCLTISVPAGYIFLEDIKQADQRERLAELAKAFFGKEVAVKIETLGDEDDGGGSRQKNGNHKSSDIKREALQGPMLQKVLDVFSDAEVREVLHRKNRQNNN
jgi:DNA polymerase-3 subunit gamma/tau